MSELDGRFVLQDRYRAGGRRRGVGSAGAPPVEDGRGRSGGLAPLRWLAEEDLVFEPVSETLHRPECPRLRGGEPVQALASGAVLERVMAPGVCAECRPDVTLTLGERGVS